MRGYQNFGSSQSEASVRTIGRGLRARWRRKWNESELASGSRGIPAPCTHARRKRNNSSNGRFRRRRSPACRPRRGLQVSDRRLRRARRFPGDDIGTAVSQPLQSIGLSWRDGAPGYAPLRRTSDPPDPFPRSHHQQQVLREVLLQGSRRLPRPRRGTHRRSASPCRGILKFVCSPREDFPGSRTPGNRRAGRTTTRAPPPRARTTNSTRSSTHPRSPTPFSIAQGEAAEKPAEKPVEKKPEPIGPPRGSKVRIQSPRNARYPIPAPPSATRAWSPTR